MILDNHHAVRRAGVKYVNGPQISSRYTGIVEWLISVRSGVYALDAPLHPRRHEWTSWTLLRFPTCSSFPYLSISNNAFRSALRLYLCVLLHRTVRYNIFRRVRAMPITNLSLTQCPFNCELQVITSSYKQGL